MEAQGSSLEVRLVCSKPSTLKKKNYPASEVNK